MIKASYKNKEIKISTNVGVYTIAFIPSCKCKLCEIEYGHVRGPYINRKEAERRLKFLNKQPKNPSCPGEYKIIPYCDPADKGELLFDGRIILFRRVFEYGFVEVDENGLPDEDDLLFEGLRGSDY